LSLTDSIRKKINGSGKDLKDAILGAAVDAVIVFLLMLPSASLPGVNDFYVAIRVSLMVFAYSIARNLKLQTHFREVLTVQCTQPTVNIQSFTSGCQCCKDRGGRDDKP